MELCFEYVACRCCRTVEVLLRVLGQTGSVSWTQAALTGIWLVVLKGLLFSLTYDDKRAHVLHRVEDISEELEEAAERSIASLKPQKGSATASSSSSAESSQAVASSSGSSSASVATTQPPTGSDTSSAPSSAPDHTNPPTTEELVAICHAFVAQLRNGTAPWVVQRLNSTYGPEPEDIASFSFWMAQALPIEEYERSKLLVIRSPRARLRLVVHWIEQLNSNW